MLNHVDCKQNCRYSIKKFCLCSAQTAWNGTQHEDKAFGKGGERWKRNNVSDQNCIVWYKYDNCIFGRITTLWFSFLNWVLYMLYYIVADIGISVSKGRNGGATPAKRWKNSIIVEGIHFVTVRLIWCKMCFWTQMDVILTAL